MIPNLSNLLLSIASEIAADASCTVGQDLFIGQAPVADDAVAVLRVYGGPQPGELRRVPAMSVQCMTRAMSSAEALDLANRVYEALHISDGGVHTDGRPRGMWSVPGKKIDAGNVTDDDQVATWDVRFLVMMQPPGELGRDDSGRVEVAFNFDVHFSMPS